MKSVFFKNLARCFSKSIREPLNVNSTIARVRIWESGYFSEDKQFIKTNVAHAMYKSVVLGTGNIGHVSVETKDFYASLWPNQLTIFNKYKIQDGHQSTLINDLESEDRDPDHLIDFNTLDLIGIFNKAKQFEKNNKYHLLGKVEVFDKDLYGYNCSSFAYSLLIAGGIKKLLISPRVVFKNYTLVTPNGLAKVLIQAKKQEELLLSTDLNGNDKKSFKK